MRAYLGVNYNLHNAAAALVVDGEFVAGAEEERFSRIKYDGNFPAEAIRFCLEYAGLAPEDLAGAAFYWRPLHGLARRVAIILARPHTIPRFLRLRDRSRGNAGVLMEHLRAPGVIRAFLGRRDLYVANLPHHLCHAASAFYPSPFERAAILSLDLSGEWSSTYAALGEGTRIRRLWEVGYPHSLGVYYAAVTQYLGFAPNADEYRVMGLAAYGEPRFADIFRRWVRYDPPDGLRIDLDVFTHHHGTDRWFGDAMVAALGPPRDPERDPQAEEPRLADVAASAQLVLEETVMRMLTHLAAETKVDRLCLAGGVALNSKMNGRIRSEGPFDDVFIQPAAHDAGTSLGAALLLSHENGAPRSRPMTHAYYGPDFSDAACLEVAKTFDQVEARRVADPAETAAARLAAGQVLGWFEGRMEWGPRALGARSIVADPRPESMKELINAKVKFRELFRPFAPAILAEKTSDWFELSDPSPFMLEVRPFRREVRDKVRAVVHVDGTGRLQTVEERTNPRFHALIRSFARRTGVPVVLNTSFNVKGEPIVCRPEDAIRCFLRTELDALLLGDVLVTRKGDPRTPPGGDA